MSTHAPARPVADLDHQFQSIAKNFAVIDTGTAQMPKKHRITVMLDLPHLKKYGREPTRELVYGCNFAVAVGDLVSCPPTPVARTPGPPPWWSPSMEATTVVPSSM